MADYPHYTHGSFEGAAILRDGVIMPIEDVVSELNRLTALTRPEPAGEVTDEEIRDLADFAHDEDGNYLEWLDGELIAFGRRLIALALSRSQPVQPAEITEDQREAVKTAVADAIGLDAYDCTRVWEAWSVGTMGEDDFVLIVEDDARVTEIADAAIAAMAHPVQPADGEVAELVEWLEQEAAEQHPGEADALPADVRDALRDASAKLRRAAALLQHLQPPLPVAVGERPWEKDGWCDEAEKCWMGWPGGFDDATGLLPSYRYCSPRMALSAVLSLPHNALPLPSPEAP